jgi:hypothetical protein
MQIEMLYAFPGSSLKRTFVESKSVVCSRVKQLNQISSPVSTTTNFWLMQFKIEISPYSISMHFAEQQSGSPCL